MIQNYCRSSFVKIKCLKQCEFLIHWWYLVKNGSWGQEDCSVGNPATQASEPKFTSQYPQESHSWGLGCTPVIPALKMKTGRPLRLIGWPDSLAYSTKPISFLVWDPAYKQTNKVDSFQKMTPKADLWLAYAYTHMSIWTWMYTCRCVYKQKHCPQLLGDVWGSYTFVSRALSVRFKKQVNCGNGRNS